MRRPVYHRTRRRAVARLLVAAVLACAPSILFAQRNDQREQPEVRDLRLNGVQQVNPRDLLRSIATSESRCKSLLWVPFCYISHSSTIWDRKVNVLQVTDVKNTTLELRALASAADAGKAWDLRCEVREKLVTFLQKNYPDSLPRVRAVLDKAA